MSRVRSITNIAKCEPGSQFFRVIGAIILTGGILKEALMRKVTIAALTTLFLVGLLVCTVWP